MKKFVVVCGPGRSGTSLACELVKACGYSFGNCNPLQKFGLRSGYNENPLSNSQGHNIPPAIFRLEEQDADAVKLIHLYAQWIPVLQKLEYDVRIIVTSRDPEEGIASGNKLYTGWKPQAIPAICGTFKRIQTETQRYLKSSRHNAYSLPFQKVIEKDADVLGGLCEFLGGGTVEALGAVIDPDIVQHAKKNPLKS